MYAPGQSLSHHPRGWSYRMLSGLPLLLCLMARRSTQKAHRSVKFCWSTTGKYPFCLHIYTAHCDSACSARRRRDAFSIMHPVDCHPCSMVFPARCIV